MARRSLYVLLLKPFKFFVKYFCTRSSIKMFLFKGGDQMGELYSRIGLTKVVFKVCIEVSDLQYRTTVKEHLHEQTP